MRVRHRSIQLMILGAMVPGAWAQPDPRAVLEQSQAALQKLSGIRYEAVGEVAGVLAQQLSRMNGTVTLVKSGDPRAPRILVDAEALPPNQPQPVRVQIASDGVYVALAEHERKFYLRRALPLATGLTRSALGILLESLVEPEPFADELGADTLEHIGVEELGGVECDVVRAVVKSIDGEIQWAIARSDRLPRRVLRKLNVASGSGVITTTLAKVTPDPDVPAEQFVLDKPPGFVTPGRESLLPEGAMAPDWTLQTGDGKSVSLKDLQGRIVLLDFWATWCGPCRMAMPGIQKMFQYYRGKPVEIYGVNVWQERETGRVKPAEFMKQNGYTYPILLRANAVAHDYQLKGIPAAYIIGPDGRVLYTMAGYRPGVENEMVALIDWHLERLKK